MTPTLLAKLTHKDGVTILHFALFLRPHWVVEAGPPQYEWKMYNCDSGLAHWTGITEDSPTSNTNLHAAVSQPPDWAIQYDEPKQPAELPDSRLYPVEIPAEPEDTSDRKRVL